MQAVIPTNPGKLYLVRFPAPILKQRAAAVTEFGDRLAALAARMLEIMRQGQGVGLAAPQAGVSLRMFVCNVTGEPGADDVFVNPTFAELRGADDKEEGCLSIPAVHVTMRRATHATINALDLHGNAVTRQGEGLLARVWQHEVDHLDGRLIIDNMSPTDEIANRRAIKQLKQDDAGAR
ncbi:MAG TPA: peptide deformylase [Rhodospirillales bacterium]|jgi:peptide deformylase